jgi:branched-chain amino acid transport system permease protein
VQVSDTPAAWSCRDAGLAGAPIFCPLNKRFGDHGAWRLAPGACSASALLAIIATIRFKQGPWGWAQARWGWSLFPLPQRLEL